MEQKDGKWDSNRARIVNIKVGQDYNDCPTLHQFLYRDKTRNFNASFARITEVRCAGEAHNIVIKNQVICYDSKHKNFDAKHERMSFFKDGVSPSDCATLSQAVILDEGVFKCGDLTFPILLVADSTVHHSGLRTLDGIPYFQERNVYIRESDGILVSASGNVIITTDSDFNFFN